MPRLAPIAIAAVLALTGCASPTIADRQGGAFTGRELDRMAMALVAMDLARSSPTFAAGAYAEVNPRAIPGILASYRRSLHREGIVQWDVRFNCWSIALGLAVHADALHMRERWHAPGIATRAAVYPIIYEPRAGGVHAAVVMVTSRGPMVVDPFAGVLTLTPAERATIRYADA